MNCLVLAGVAEVREIVNVSSGRHLVCIVLDPHQRNFSGNADGFQMTTSSRPNSNTD